MAQQQTRPATRTELLDIANGSLTLDSCRRRTRQGFRKDGRPATALYTGYHCNPRRGGIHFGEFMREKHRVVKRRLGLVIHRRVSVAGSYEIAEGRLVMKCKRHGTVLELNSGLGSTRPQVQCENCCVELERMGPMFRVAWEAVPK